MKIVEMRIPPRMVMKGRAFDMRKKILASLMAITFFTTSGLISFAENEPEKDASQENVITTGTQERAAENEVDVDADIEDDIAAAVPVEIETIKISNVDEFLEFVDNCKLNTWSDNKEILLTSDISLVGKEFYGIPDFGGVFDGQGHTISEINISKGQSYVGLFIHVEKNAVIQNLNVSGSVIPTGSPVIIGGIAGENYGLIKDCSFKGVVKGNDYVGGIVGMNQLSGNVSFCTSEGFISGVHFTGGICGENMGNIANCRNEAMVNTTNTDTEITVDSMESLNKVLSLIKNGINKEDDEASSDVTVSDTGGIVGLSIGIVSRCINNGEIGYEHVGYNVGGIAGRQSGYLYSCSNNGKIKGRKDVGGIVGQAEPYIQVDLASDIAYQLSEAIAQLHDTVSATLADTKNQSDVVSARLAIIQKFTGQAVQDTKFIANGTIDYANDISGATNEAFSRVEYVMDESSKNGGPIDNLSSAAGNARNANSDLRKAVGDLDIEQYIVSDDERQQYNNAKTAIAEGTAIYERDYNNSYRVYYNLYVRKHRGDTDYNLDDAGAKSGDILYYNSNGVLVDDSTWSTSSDPFDSVIEGYIESGEGPAIPGSWKHSDGTTFPASDSTNDSSLNTQAISKAQEDANDYARRSYYNPVSGSTNYSEDIATQSQILAQIYANHANEMRDASRTDAQAAINNLDAASANLQTAGQQTKSILSNIAGRDDIRFPRLDEEYRAHTNSLADNMAAMNDNFGLLNSEMNNATGVLVGDLQAVNDQFNNILNLYTDALDGVLDKDYTTMYSDESYKEASYTTDATVDSCFNFGKCEGDIDISGIAGTMAIEYEFDKEGDITGIKDANLNSSYITKCVLRNNRNYGNIESQKDYAGGICGLQEMGTILNCGSYAKIESTDGNYVGGVAGSSVSYIVESYAKGELDGNTYVGGITGDGMHIKDCLTLVSVTRAENWYGAISGHVAENGEVRNNYFVSDDLAGIDRVSYALKAEPVSYAAVEKNEVFEEIMQETEESEEKLEVVPLSTGTDEEVAEEVKYRDLPHEFSNITVNFVLEDEDLEDGSEQVDRLSKKYGESLKPEEYPSVPEKEGYYVDWDVPEVDRLVCDVTATATYKLYRTTLAIDDSAEKNQSILLVDGNFKEGDKIEATRTVLLNEENNNSSLDEMEIIELTIPDDGQDVHQIRFKPDNDYNQVLEIFGKFASSTDYALYEVTENTKVKLTPTGKMGAYSTYELEGNTHTLSYGVSNAQNIGFIIIAIFLLAFVLIIVIIIIVVNIIKRHGGKVPKIFGKFVMKVSDRIENKETIFFDDTDELQAKVREKITETAAEIKEENELEQLTDEISEYKEELAKEKGEELPEKREFDNKKYRKLRRKTKKNNKK
jgi:hypothetical protein